MVSLELDYVKDFVTDEQMMQAQPLISTIHRQLIRSTSPWRDFLGWLSLPSESMNLGAITTAAANIREQSDALVVIGIGGSYLGARAAFEWIKPAYYNQLTPHDRQGPELYFVGNHISSDEVQDLYRVLQGKRISLNVISKSGTTTEPAIGFRLLRDFLIQQVGETEAKTRIFVTTDQNRGALKSLASAEGYPTFVIPDDVGGRYSVLTPVGLLPLAATGVDITALLQGARSAQTTLGTEILTDNPAYQYAVVRNLLYRKGFTTEVLAHFEPSLHFFAEWWKQLFGESEGKNRQGIFPSSVGYTTDLHSMGQYVQEGYRNLFETIVDIRQVRYALSVPTATIDDGLDYLVGKELSYVNQRARMATQQAHAEGGVPNLLISVADKSAQSLGELFYFFELACAASGLLMGIHPFNQPGVENYKTKMFTLLGKPGYQN